MTVAKSITVKARGLFLNPNDLGAIPDGALSQADNVVVSRDAIIECRRGFQVRSGTTYTRVWEWRGNLVAWDVVTGTLAVSSDLGETWTSLAGVWFPEPGQKIRMVEAARCAYFTMADGTYRLDSATGSLRPGGEERGLDCTATLGVDGTAFPAGEQGGWLAYRTLFGYRDANQNIVYGAPSARALVQQPLVTAAVGQVVSDGSRLVTVDLGTGLHPFVTGQYVIQVNADAGLFPSGVKGPITVVDANTFRYTDNGCTPSSTSVAAIRYTNNIRDVIVSATIPPGVDSTHFFQVYRSESSNVALWPEGNPGDELGLVYEGPVPGAATLSGLVRSGGTVTGTTVASHGWPAGIQVKIPVTVTGSGVTLDILGSSAGATSSDGGVTWADHDPPVGTYYGIAWGGTRFVGVGDGVSAYSTDGVTWNAGSIAAKVWDSVATNGTFYLAVCMDGGTGNAAKSSDGATWTYSSPKNAALWDITWNGSVFLAVGDYCSAKTGDGVNWIASDAPFLLGHKYYGVTWNGSIYCAVGNGIVHSSHGICATSYDGYSWTERTIPDLPGGTWMSVAYGNGVFVAVGYNSCATSAEGVIWTSRTIPDGGWESVSFCYDRFVAVGSGTNVCATSTDGVTWVPRTPPAGAYHAVAAASVNNFWAGLKTVLTVPTGNTFTYAEGGPDGAASTSQVATPVTVGILDVLPEEFRGATLYTSPSQETIAQANNMPPMARDVAQFRDHVFYAAVTPLAGLSVSLLGSGPSSGVQVGDVVTLGSGTVTAAATEDILAKQFKVYTSTDFPGSPGQAISATAESIMRVVNANAAALGVTLYDLSDESGVPGQMFLEALVSGESIAFGVSDHATAWSPASTLTQAPQVKLNVLMWSKAGLPDAVPILNSMNVGNADKAILRIVPTRNSLFVFKQDGIWQVTGYGPPWQLDPFDLTVEVVGSSTVVPLDNQVYGFTHHGVMRVSDTGVTLISRPIDPPIQVLLDAANRPTVQDVAFGMADESDHKYYLFLPSSSSDTFCTQAYVYDLFTDSWMHRTDNAYDGLVCSVDDRMYLAKSSPGGIFRERKDFAVTDFRDSTQGIPVTVTWAPKFGQDPAALNHFIEVGLLFRAASFTTAYLDFSTNLDSAWQTVTVNGSDYGTLLDGTKSFQLRVPVPSDMARAGLLYVRWRLTEAEAVMQIQALSVRYNPGPDRFGR